MTQARSEAADFYATSSTTRILRTISPGIGLGGEQLWLSSNARSVDETSAPGRADRNDLHAWSRPGYADADRRVRLGCGSRSVTAISARSGATRACSVASASAIRFSSQASN